MTEKAKAPAAPATPKTPAAGAPRMVIDGDSLAGVFESQAAHIQLLKMEKAALNMKLERAAQEIARLQTAATETPAEPATETPAEPATETPAEPATETPAE